MIEIIPAVDLKEGRCVRLVQGRMEEETLYYEDPLEAARLWVDQGARRLHLVDLDGATGGSPANLEALRRIVDGVAVPVQLGGGIRSEGDARRYLDLGVERVILGTLACREPARTAELCRRLPGKIVLGVDAREGYVAVEGWRDVTRTTAADLIAAYADVPIAGIVYTDIQRDGMLTGPNVAALRQVAAASPFPVIASGGISCAGDITAVARLESFGVNGVIVGKALYDGKLTLREAHDAAAALV